MILISLNRQAISTMKDWLHVLRRTVSMQNSFDGCGIESCLQSILNTIFPQFSRFSRNEKGENKFIVYSNDFFTETISAFRNNIVMHIELSYIIWPKTLLKIMFLLRTIIKQCQIKMILINIVDSHTLNIKHLGKKFVIIKKHPLSKILCTSLDLNSGLKITNPEYHPLHHGRGCIFNVVYIVLVYNFFCHFGIYLPLSIYFCTSLS